MPESHLAACQAWPSVVPPFCPPCCRSSSPLLIPGIGHGGAMTVGYPPNCANIPVFTIVDPTMGNFEAAMAHEFMHVLQFAY